MALTPIATAFLAAALALAANRFLDRQRAIREHSVTVVAEFRADVRSAAELAAEYWGGNATNKLLLESKLKMLDQEIGSSARLVNDKNWERSDDFSAALERFQRHLTGADFEAAHVPVNQAHVRDVVGSAAILRRTATLLAEDRLKNRLAPRR